ncbi:hypothetical protein PVAP13_7KG023427 [Panicum virgatum]|uniref:Uncharacterized protein n=1 Tax=Panicum virgatum TaxID=38727 RepID=A0A8T0QJ06_PANVG|nr:hypothetical protein PVAP13_7KG023427 [Panicum virgatum]
MQTSYNPDIIHSNSVNPQFVTHGQALRPIRQCAAHPLRYDLPTHHHPGRPAPRLVVDLLCAHRPAPRYRSAPCPPANTGHASTGNGDGLQTVSGCSLAAVAQLQLSLPPAAVY